jgi:NADPH:quinone reductase-like Zn-dependent oxidoreductase
MENSKMRRMRLGLVATCAASVIGAGALLTARQINDTMRAVVVVDGKPTVQQIAAPVPGPGDVRVRLRAAAVNPVDWKAAARPAPPRASSSRNVADVPGFDGAGVIDRVGEGVTDWKVGDEVIVFSDDRGAYAELVVAPAQTVVRKPDALTFEKASGIPTVAYAAYNAVVDIADVQRGQRVLIHGGAGGVGSAAVQLAKSRGAFVLATASERNHEFLRSIGVDRPIDYNTAPFESLVSGLDVVVNTVDADTAARSIVAIKRGGILVSIAGPAPMAACEKAGIRCSGRAKGTPVAEVITQVVQLAEEGKYDVNIDATYPLEQVTEAWAKSQTAHTRGKIVLTMQ